MHPSFSTARARPLRPGFGRWRGFRLSCGLCALEEHLTDANLAAWRMSERHGIVHTRCLAAWRRLRP